MLKRKGLWLTVDTSRLFVSFEGADMDHLLKFQHRSPDKKKRFCEIIMFAQKTVYWSKHEQIYCCALLDASCHQYQSCSTFIWRLTFCFLCFALCLAMLLGTIPICTDMILVILSNCSGAVVLNLADFADRKSTSVTRIHLVSSCSHSKGIWPLFLHTKVTSFEPSSLAFHLWTILSSCIIWFT